MNKAGIYIKKILALLLCVSILYLSFDRIKIYYSLPVLFLIYSLLSYKITSVKPKHLFNFNKSENYTSKGGLYSALIILITPPAVLYDIAVWTLWGVYLVFDLLTDFIFLIETGCYWMAYAIIWFLKLYIPPLVIMFNSFIHYLVKWPWWIYVYVSRNFRHTYNTNFVIISLWGSISGLFSIFIFYFLGFILDIEGLILFGIILSLAPLSWSFGEIASVRHQNIRHKKYREIKSYFQNGTDTLRSTLLYITLFIFLFIVQFLLNVTGWIENAGLAFSGITITLNSIINVIILLLALLIVLGTIISPSYRLYESFKETRLADSLSLLKAIFRRLPKYIISFIPGSIFGALGLVLPLLFLALIFFLTYTVKDFVIDLKIDNLKQNQADTRSEVRSYELGNRIKLISYAKKPPADILQDMMHRNNLEYELKLYNEDISSLKEENVSNEQEQRAVIMEIDKEIQATEDELKIAELNYRKETIKNNIEQVKAKNAIVLKKRESDVNYLERHIKQLPVLFFFWGIWCVVFGGFVLAFLVSYTGNVCYDIYSLKEDNKPLYFTLQLKEQNSKNNLQPLTGFTLLTLTVLLLIYLIYRYKDVTIVIPLRDWFFRMLVNPHV
jgi:hypothetical protein